MSMGQLVSLAHFMTSVFYYTFEGHNILTILQMDLFVFLKWVKSEEVFRVTRLCYFDFFLQNQTKVLVFFKLKTVVTTFGQL